MHTEKKYEGDSSLTIDISTSRFGALSVDEADMIHFPSGIPGFEDRQQWVLAGDEDTAVMWLQSMEEGGLALPVALPEAIYPGYNAHIPRENLAFLGEMQEGELAILLVLCIPPNEPWEMTANLKAPIVINRGNRLGVQTLAANEEYEFNHYVLGDHLRQGMKEQAQSVGDAE